MIRSEERTLIGERRYKGKRKKQEWGLMAVKEGQRSKKKGDARKKDEQRRQTTDRSRESLHNRSMRREGERKDFETSEEQLSKQGWLERNAIEQE